jgi:hypothetical protein
MPGAEDRFPVTRCLWMVLRPHRRYKKLRVEEVCGAPTYRIVEGFPMCREHLELFNAIPEDKA